MTGEAATLGLLAGEGALPLELAREARRRGRPVRAVAFKGHAQPELEREAEVCWLHPGQVTQGVAVLREAGVEEAVLVGRVDKRALFAPESLHLDPAAERLLAGLPERRDGELYGQIAAFLERVGIRLLPQSEFLAHLLAPEGPLGALRPDEAVAADIAFGLPLARALAALEIGQTLAVKDRAVVAVEALEGTDAAIRRAGEMVAGVRVIKVARPGVDPRFDLPVIGPGTLDALVAARAAALACEAGRTLVVEREALVARADASGIALLGLRAEPLP